MVSRRHSFVRRGFALPTVLIASIVLLTVLAVSVSATSSIRTTLKNQYYAQLAQVAGESGVAYAKACLAANGNVPQWSDAKPLTPSSDCSGNPNPLLDGSVKALVVAGGGGGGSRHGGGGGGGGLIYNSNVSVTPTSYPVVIGGGGVGTASGASGNADTATNGGNSSLFGLTAIGGGAGRGLTVGAAGGSGGGGGISGGTGGSGTSGQGNVGGTGVYSTYYMGGGGGGAGGAGVNAAYPSNIEPAGGIGVSSSITGVSVLYATGGKGASYNLNTVGVVGNPNTGNGGGGGGGESNGGAAGGSGVAIISYSASGNITATGGTVTIVNGYKIHTFTASGSFVVSAVGSAVCPSDPRCSVTVNGDVRSAFSVGLPSLDADGKAVTIPNTGYVEITRTSNGAVWRTYRQPSVQAAVVPNLCSGSTASSLGWSNTVKATTQDTIAASTAQSITLSNTALNAGRIFFRKDFSVTKTGTYVINALTPTSSDVADVYVDNIKVTTSTGASASGSMTLNPGCHTVQVVLNNKTIIPKITRFTLSIQRNGDSSPVTVSDTSWRVTAGATTHYSSPNYYSLNSWQPASVMGTWNNPNLPWGGGPTSWVSMSGDSLASWINTTNSVSGYNYPSSSYSWFRMTQSFTLVSPTQVKLSTSCDNACDIYVDGTFVYNNSVIWSTPNSAYITLPAGTHSFGVRLYNSGSSINPSGFLFSAVNASNGTVLARSDGAWETSSYWSTTADDYFSYDTTYLPVPNSSPIAQVNALVVAGGGGGGSFGGGGGAGGVVYKANTSFLPGVYPVIVGAGGAGAPTSDVVNGNGINGLNSSFSSFLAVGGGGGGTRIGSSMSYMGSAGSPGGSGGGGGNSDSSAGGVGGPLVIGQGNIGGAGASGTAGTPNYGHGSGGGAGGAGMTGKTNGSAGAVGGIGLQFTQFASVGGSPAGWFGGGGGGGVYTTGTTGFGGNGGGGNGGGNNGGVPTTVGVAGVANTGGGGGGGGYTYAGGAGGSGIVIISYLTGSLTATGGTITTNGGNTIHTFTSNGTFTIVSIP